MVPIEEVDCWIQEVHQFIEIRPVEIEARMPSEKTGKRSEEEIEELEKDFDRIFNKSFHCKLFVCYPRIATDASDMEGKEGKSEENCKPQVHKSCVLGRFRSNECCRYKKHDGGE